MAFITTVPIVFGKGINVWLGLVLILLITVQLASGFVIYKGTRDLISFHRLNAIFLALVATVHAYYGIGVWFFGFKYGG